MRNIHEARNPQERIEDLKSRIANIDEILQKNPPITTQFTLEKLKQDQAQYRAELENLTEPEEFREAA